MSSKRTAHEAIRVIAALSDRLLQAGNVGVPASAMARMEHEGVLSRVVPGVYIGTQHERHPLIEAAAWTLRYPLAVGCLLTAANYYTLTDAFPRGTWLYVPKGTTVPRSRTSLLHIVQTAPRLIDRRHDEANGISHVDVHGVRLRITSPDRTVVDLWRYPNRIASEHALVALRRRASSKDFQVAELARLARRVGGWSRIEPVLQGMLVR